MAALTKNINESISIKDARRGASRSVVSDIIIGQGDITQAQFDELLANGSAVGYAPFRIFIDGNYEYDRALFRAALQAGNASRPRITELSLGVDLPDVFDRGTASVPASKVTISCSRFFYHIEEVSVTVKGGVTICVPSVSNERIEAGVAKFDVELIAEGSQRVAGDISWSVRGY